MRRLNSQEAVALCRYAKAMWPHMAVDEFTPDAWGDVLAGFRAEDCKEAIVNLAKREDFVSVGAIYGEVKRIRHKRVLSVTLPDAPPGLNPAEYAEWFARVHREAADGNHAEPAALPSQRAPWTEEERAAIKDARRAAFDKLAESKAIPE